MSWQVAILLHGLLSGLRNIFLRLLGKSKQDYSVNTLLYSFSAVFILGICYVLVTKTSVDIALAWDYKYFLLLGGVLFATLNYMSIKLFRLVSASVGSLMSLLNPLVVLLLAIILTEETLSFLQILGACILLSSVVLVERSNVKRQNKHFFTISKSLILAIIISVLFGFASLNEKYLLNQIGVSTYLVFGWGSQFLATIVIVWLLRGVYKKPVNIREKVYLVCYALLLAFSGGLFIYSLVKSNSISLTTVSASSKVVVTMILAYIFLRERKHNLLKMVSLALSIVGMYLLFQ